MENNKEELEIKENGATQTKVAEGYEYIPVPALEALARTMKYGGEKYGRKNHLKISCEENLGRAVRHVYKYLDGDTTEEHLDHAISRMAMAIDSKVHAEDFNNPIVVENKKDEELISIKIIEYDLLKYSKNDVFTILDENGNIVGKFKFDTVFNLGRDYYVNCDFINPSKYNTFDYILKQQGKYVYKIITNDTNDKNIKEGNLNDDDLVDLKIDCSKDFKNKLINLHATCDIYDKNNNLLGIFDSTDIYEKNSEMYCECVFFYNTIVNKNDYKLISVKDNKFLLFKEVDIKENNLNDEYEYIFYEEKPIYIPKYAFNELKQSKLNVIRLKNETVGRIYYFENGSHNIARANFRLKSNIDLSKYIIEFSHIDENYNVFIFNLVLCDTRKETRLNINNNIEENSNITSKIIRLENSKYANTLPYSPREGILKNEILFNGEKIGKIIEISIKNKDDKYAYAVCELNRDIEIYHLSFLKLNYIQNNIFVYEYIPNIIDITDTSRNVDIEMKNIKVDKMPDVDFKVNYEFEELNDTGFVKRNEPKFLIEFDNKCIGEIKIFEYNTDKKTCDIIIYFKDAYDYIINKNYKFELFYDRCVGYYNYFYKLKFVHVI